MDKQIRVDIVVDEKAIDIIVKKVKEAVTCPEVLAMGVKADGLKQKFEVHNPNTCSWLPVLE